MVVRTGDMRKGKGPRVVVLDPNLALHVHNTIQKPTGGWRNDHTCRILGTGDCASSKSSVFSLKVFGCKDVGQSDKM